MFMWTSPELCEDTGPGQCKTCSVTPSAAGLWVRTIWRQQLAAIGTGCQLLIWYPTPFTSIYLVPDTFCLGPKELSEQIQCKPGRPVASHGQASCAALGPHEVIHKFADADHWNHFRRSPEDRGCPKLSAGKVLLERFDKYRKKKKHINFFNITLLPAPQKTLKCLAQEKTWCTSFPGEERKKGPTESFSEECFGSKTGSQTGHLGPQEVYFIVPYSMT